MTRDERTQTFPLWPTGAPGARGTAPEDTPRLTPFPLDTPGPHAAVIVCPGGGYAMRAPHEGAPIAQWLNSLGVAAFVLDYRVAPYRHPVPHGDAQRAIRTVRARADEWSIDPARIGILGFSAGGHLCVSAATIFDEGDPLAADPVERASSRPDAFIACYPVITFGEHRHDGSMRNLLGPEPDPELRERLTLENRVTPDTPPGFLWHTADDAAVPVENALLLVGAMRRCGVPFALHVFAHGPHGLGLAPQHPDVAQWTNLCAGWLKGIGFR